jgi:hypothetical protein
MPVNMPTHGHGHGYSDLNFLVPELISSVQFSKGPYFADQGDFAAAGTATIRYANILSKPIVRVSGGGQGFGRALFAVSPPVGGGHLLAALELQRNDGPWTRPDEFQKFNGVLRYSRGDTLNGMAATLMSYRGRWNATDQIPARAVDDGRIQRFDGIDPDGGGTSSRYSGSFEWQRARGAGSTSLSLFGIAYDLDLFSNFTYFLEDPDNGDQFQQTDDRFVSGGRFAHRRIDRWFDRSVQTTAGIEARNDAIGTVGLYRTTGRARLRAIREDSVLQTGLAGFLQQEVQWTPWLRTLSGLRADRYRFDVRAGNPANAGIEHAGLVSPKGGAVIGPWNGTEVYVNAGMGFHSNDARGATIAVDPITGAPLDRVTPLARVRGAEVGLRSVRVPHLQTSLAAWTLAVDSELIFVGDAGTTEPGRPSRRYGIEWSNYYRPQPWLLIESDLSVSRARFTGSDPAGRSVPGAVGMVLAAAITADGQGPAVGGVRLRHVGSRPLTEDGRVRSEAVTLVSLEAGWRFTSGLRLAIDVFNLFDARGNDVEYFYRSRLPGEPHEGIEDVHYHPGAPRSARLSLIVGF